MKSFPIRRIVAVTVTALCIWLAFANHDKSVVLEQTAVGDWGIGAPPPPPGQFLEIFLVIPGTLAGLPLILIGGIHGPDWLVSLGLILGAAFFWYAVAWSVDCSRGTTETDRPPKLIRVYFSALRVLSVLLFPLLVFGVSNGGGSSCANGAQPSWVGYVMFGIIMTWVTIGVFFAWRNFQSKRERAPLACFPGSE
jgi:hypothetical protein